MIPGFRRVRLGQIRGRTQPRGDAELRLWTAGREPPKPAFGGSPKDWLLFVREIDILPILTTVKRFSTFRLGRCGC